MKTQRQNSSIVWAVAIIILGSLFLMDNFQMFNFTLPENLISWKLIFVFIAFAKIAKGKIFGGIFWGLVAYAVYFPTILSQFSVHSIVQLWPLLLIGAGLDILLRRDRRFEDC